MNPERIHNESGNDSDPFLSGNLRSNPFRVPEGYFGEFAARVNQRLTGQENRPHPAFADLSRRFRLTAAAAVILLVVISGGLMIYSYLSGTDDSALPGISLQDLEEAGVVQSLDYLTLVNFFIENDIDLLPEDVFTSDQAVSEDDIEQYLLQSNELENLLQNL